MLDHDNDTISIINGGKLSEAELEKIFVLKALRVYSHLLDDAFVFEKTVYVLNDVKPNIESLQPPTVLHIAKAVKFINQLYPTHQWSHDVIYYIAHIAHEEGWATLPSILKFADHALVELQPETPELDEDQHKLQALKHKAVEIYLAG